MGYLVPTKGHSGVRARCPVLDPPHVQHCAIEVDLFPAQVRRPSAARSPWPEATRIMVASR